MTIPLEQLILLFTSLFAIFSPPANIGPFAANRGTSPGPSSGGLPYRWLPRMLGC
jgi:hypothetical protein